MDIDLGLNQYTYRYDGNTVVTNGQWDTTPGDGVTLGGLNVWMQLGNANGQNAFVYYDDFNLRVVPEPAAALMGILSLVGLGAFRRRG